MITLIPIGDPQVVGVSIDGSIKKSDIDAVIEACNQAFASTESVAIYVEVAHLGLITLDALIADMTYALSHLSHFAKKAVVSDVQWMVPLVEVSDKLFPSLQVKHFSPDQREEALAWVRGTAIAPSSSRA